MNNNNQMYKVCNDVIFSELIKNQNKNIISDKKLLYSDLKRISKYLSKSIFDNSCSLWNGYITVIKNDSKKSYINFYFNGKKYALHRLLYVNYIGELNDSEYIKFNCSNKGICCNINHFYKINKDSEHVKVIIETENKCIETNKNIINIKNNDDIKPKDIIVGFN
jgi:hypothetical protein